MSSAGAAIFAEISESYGSGAIDDPYPLFTERRQTTPVMAGDIMVELGLPSAAAAHQAERRTFTLFRYDDISGALRDAGTFSSSIWIELFEPLLGRVILGMDGEEHRAWRGLLMPVFTRQSVRTWDETILRPVARQYVDEMEPAKHADLVEFAFKFPLRVIYEIIGFTDDPEAYEEFQATALSILLALAVETDPAKAELMARNIGRAVQAAQDLYAGVKPVVERKRAEGATGHDLISHLIRTEFEGGKLDDEQITVFVRSILPAATENTTRQFLNTLTLLLERPTLLDAVRRDPEKLMPAIVEGERCETPAMVVPRITTRDVEVRGVTIPAGSAVLLALGSGNRDEEAFPNPDEFRIDRPGPHPFAFGFGAHICPGMSTARLEIRAMLEALFDRLPNLRFDPDVEQPRIRGVNFRGPSSLPVVWD